MNQTDLPAQTGAAPQLPGDLLDQVRAYVDQSVAPNTRRAYAADWRHFQSWCQIHRLEPLPASPKTVAAYLSALADGSATEEGKPYTAATIRRRMTSIRIVHGAREAPDPTDTELVAKTWRGIRRDEDVSVAQKGREALLADHIRAVVEALEDDQLKGRRDRALVLVGYATGARRGELAALDVGDLDFRPEGMLVHIRRSKTDQAGRGRTASVHYGEECCAVSALKGWLEAADIQEGAVFRTVDRWGNLRGNRLSGRSINRAVKAAAQAAGMDSSRVGAHSLRAGHVTQRRVAGDPTDAIMDQTGHRSASTMRRYDRRAKEFRHDESESLGL